MAAQGSPGFGAATSTVLLPVISGAPVGGRLLGASQKGIYLGLDNTGKPDEIPCALAILPASSVRLPLAMVTAEPLPVIAPDDPIAVGEGAVKVGRHVWYPARWFDPRPARLRVPEPWALAEAAEALWNLDDDEVGVPLLHAWRAATALAAGDAEPCGELIGSGPGLTPAGDDVVAGAMAACALYGAGPRAGELERLVERACLATTTLSAALLGCAARGQVVPQASELLRALGGGTAIPPALTHLRGVGSTSGTALAIGLVAALTVAGALTPGSSTATELHSHLHAQGALASFASAPERPQSWAVAP